MTNEWVCPKCGEPMLKHSFAASGGPPVCVTYIEGEEEPCGTCGIVPVNGKCICNTPGWDSSGKPL